MTYMPSALIPRPRRSGRTLVISPYNPPQLTMEKERRDRLRRDRAALNEALRQIDEFSDGAYKGGDFDDLMEHFAALAILGVDTDSQAVNLGWSDRELVAGYESMNGNQVLSEYASFLQEQLSSTAPAIANMSQAEFEALFLAAVREEYDENGAPYYTADIDLPVPDGYTSINVKISAVG